METQTLHEQTYINENAPTMDFKQQKLTDLVDMACSLKRQIDELSEDLEKVKAVFRELALKDMEAYKDKSVFSGNIGTVEVFDDTRTTVSPTILNAFLEARGKSELLLKLVNVKVTEVRSIFGSDSLLDIGQIDFRPRSKVYVKPKKQRMG